MLRGLSPSVILDIGSGRGTLLWPLLAGFPDVEITSVEMKPRRVSDIDAVRKGGIQNLAASQMDGAQLGFVDKSFEITTGLEVLEHVADAVRMAGETVRVTRRFVIASVPSREDENPEHIRLFDKAALEMLFLGAGAARVSVDYLRGHMIALAKI
jgi:2-polyprenyl-3-methyl-5-hydroxy-6-metoxy-1,4-benzoquinol methylase